MLPTHRPQWTVAEIRQQDPRAYAALQEFLWECGRQWPEIARVEGLEGALEIFEGLIDKGWLRPVWLPDGRLLPAIWDSRQGEYMIINSQ